MTPSLTKILRDLITFELGIIGSPWSWKKMSWTLQDLPGPEEVPVPEGDEAKALQKNKLVMAKRIIFYSIKDHLIP